MLVVVNHDTAGNVGMAANSQGSPAVKKSMVADDGVVTDLDAAGIKKISADMNGRR